MAEQEGSKAMSIYIVACFVLAAVALVGYKVMEDRRNELASDYEALAANLHEIAGVYYPSINEYYYMVKLGLIEPHDQGAMDNAPSALRQLAEERYQLTAGVGDANQLVVTPPPGGGREVRVGRESYREYRCRVDLRRVSQAQWQGYLADSVQLLSKFAVLESLTVKRDQVRFDRIDVTSGASGADSTRWNVTFEFVWFGPS